MKTLLKITTVLVLVGFGLTVMADHHSEGGERKTRLDRMTQHLGLSEEQVEEITAIHAGKKAAIEPFHEQIKGIRDEMKVIASGYDKQIEESLTEEQLEKFTEMKERRKHKMMRKMHRKQGDGGQKRWQH